MKLRVFMNAFGVRREVGMLAEAGARILFEYSPAFLESGIQLSPFKLPLEPGVFEDEKKTFNGLFGLFDDSLPDGWGRLLLDRKLRQSGSSYGEVPPVRLLSMAGRDPMGALEYEPSEDATGNPADIELDSLQGEIDDVLAGSGTDVLDELLELSGSSGGARPKIVAWVSADFKTIVHGGRTAPDGFSPWIIKFSEKHDPDSAGELEYRYSLAAKAAHVTMPDTHFFPLKRGGGCFGVRRFDRTPRGKVHVHTACGLLHASHRYASLDYENLLRLTLVLTRNQSDLEEMTRRMVFNVKCRNRDDHSRNFAFMMTEDNQWRLAPAYDLTSSTGINGEQTAMVNGKGRDISDDDLIATAATCGIGAGKMRRMISDVEKARDEYLS